MVALIPGAGSVTSINEVSLQGCPGQAGLTADNTLCRHVWLVGLPPGAQWIEETVRGKQPHAVTCEIRSNRMKTFCH